MDKHLHYDIIDFAGDPSFINWVNQANAADVEYWDQWLSKNPEKQEDILKARQVVSRIRFEDLPIIKEIEDSIWQKIKEKTFVESTTKSSGDSVRSIMRYLPYMAAAVLLIVVAVIGLQRGAYDSEVVTVLAQTKTEMLPDGSKVYMNASTRLSYNKLEWAEHREVMLDGEAFFEVITGSSFVVTTDNGTVEVLGTSFNVYSRLNTLNVVCETGRVSVKSQDKETILTPAKAVLVSGYEHNTIDAIDPKTMRSQWRNGVYTYKDITLAEVIEDLERQLDIEVVISPEWMSKSFTGSFNVNNRENALSSVFWPLGLKFKADGHKLMVQ